MDKYFDTFSLNKKLLSLSTRLKNIAEKRNYQSVLNHQILADDLKYNLSNLIAEVIVHHEMDMSTLEEVEALIANYNEKHGCQYKVNIFLDKGYLRLINGEVKMATMVSRFLRFIESPDKNRDRKIVGLQDPKEINCLLIIYYYIQDQQIGIKENKLNAIIQDVSPSIDISFLKQKNLIRQKGDSSYIYTDGDYNYYLGSRIAAALWQKIMSPDLTLELFRKFAKLVEVFGIWPEDMGGFLGPNIMQQVSNYAKDVLNSEFDLLYAGTEVRKYYMDNPSFDSHMYSDVLPDFEIEATDPADIIKEILYYQIGPDSDFFELEESRGIYVFLTRLLIKYDSLRHPLENTLAILKNSPNPYIKWLVYREIRDNFQEEIPFLLQDIDLAPICFLLLSDLKLKRELLNSSDRDAILEFELSILSDIYKDVFKAFLELHAHTPYYEAFCRSIAKILISMAEVVFPNHVSQHDLVKHNMLKSRYQESLKVLSDKIFDPKRSNYYSNSIPRFIDYILKGVFEAIKDIVNVPSRNAIIKLQTGKIDLLIELFSLGGNEISNGDADERVFQQLIATKTEIIHYIYECVLNYFTASQVESYDIFNQMKLQNPRYDGDVFGIEIIDWPLIYMHLFTDNLHQILHTAIIGSIAFNISADKYEEQNNQQKGKIVNYLNILIYTYIRLQSRTAVSSHTSDRPIRLMHDLERFISELSIAYSQDDLAHSRIDVFSESFYFNSNIYHKSLNSLLYQALSYFSVRNATAFFDEFFKDSNAVDRMLTAINRIENQQIKDLLIGKIENVDLENFIMSRNTVTELENTLVEAVNSEKLYEFSQPLLMRIEAHFAYRQISTPQARKFLIRIKLLLAFKRKDIKFIENFPVETDGHDDELRFYHRTKDFYLGLHFMYNDKQYNLAIQKFKVLHDLVPNDFEYAYNLYRARILKNIAQ